MIQVLRGHDGHVYFEASAMIITLIRLGKLLESRAKRRTTEALNQLLAMIPSTAHVLADDGTIIDRDISTVQPGTTILVRPGEKIPWMEQFSPAVPPWMRVS